MTSSYSKLVSAIVLFITLTVTIATAEQSFSRLKIISIKVKEAKKLEIDKLINIFAVSLQRKRPDQINLIVN
jgi:hypothetical protein